MENVQNKLPALPTLDAEQAIHGQRIEFIDKEWFLNGVVIPSGQEFLVLGIKKVVQRWEDGKPVEAIVEHPDRELPDIEALNRAIPQSEWDMTPDGEPALRGICHTLCICCDCRTHRSSRRSIRRKDSVPLPRTYLIA